MGSFNNRRLLSDEEPPNIPKPCCFIPMCSTCPTAFPFPPPSPLIENELKQSKHISPTVIIIVAILGGCFLLVSYYAIIVKYCSNWNNSRRAAPQIEEEDITHEDFLDENQGPVVDHPIWYITTVGLEQSIINSIAICKYKKGEGLVEGTECSVCLNEFQEDESLRLLPKCSHAFHLPCIDTWLRSHTNCPVCRAPIISNPIGTALTAMPPNSNDSGVEEETQLENSESESGLGTDQRGEGGVSERIQHELEEQDRRRDIGIPKENSPSPIQRSEFRVLSDLSDIRRAVGIGIQPVRRSASMDFSPASIFCFSLANSLPVEVEEEEEGSSAVQLERGKKTNLNPTLSTMMGSSSKGRLSQKSSVSMKRSLSSGGKLTSSRSSQNRSSILPL